MLSPAARDRPGDRVHQTPYVGRNVPGADVDRLRRIFRYRRPLWHDELPDL